MNSYERFDAVLSGKKPDRMPLYILTIACSVASEILGREINSGGDSLHFREELSWLDGDTAHSEFVHKYHEDAIELNRKLGADIVRETWRSRSRPSKKLDDYTLLFGNEDGAYTVKRYFPETQSYGIVDATGGPSDSEELKKHLIEEMKKDEAVTDDKLNVRYTDLLDFKKLADPYFPCLAGTLGMPFSMFDTPWLEASVLEAEFLSEYFIFKTEKMLKLVKWFHTKGFRFINGGADIASNTGPAISPAAFGKIFVPALKLISDECSKYNMLYCYKTDGNIWKISDQMFLEGGVQAYGEVDRLAGMTVGSIRKRYPQLVICGNVSSITLSTGSVEEVREETRATLHESQGYYYIAGPSNAIVHGTPVENVYAMIDEIKSYKP